MLRLAEKAFWPAQLPFPVMHVDTGHNFPEVLEFRDRGGRALGARLVVGVGAGRHRRRAAWSRRPARSASRNRLQTTTLLDAIEEHRFDAVFGGARRDEEKARAKERVFSFRDEFGQWDPKNQRPELWSLYNGRHRKGEHIRVFPLSNWTELDIWQYIAEEDIELPSIYFAHRRQVFRRDGMLLAVGAVRHHGRRRGDRSRRTCATAPSATRRAPARSSRRAATVEEVIAEVAATRITERGATRADDRVSEAGHGRPQERRVLLMESCSGSPPPARSTTARAR